MRTLFLHPPSFDGYDGGAGARYQMKREVRSFWYPTWLAQPAALVEGSKLIDAPPHGLSFEDIAPEFMNRDLVVMHTSTPSFKSDVKTAEMIKAINPHMQDRLHRRQGRGRTGQEPDRGDARSTSWPATSSISPSRKSPTVGPGPTSRASPTAMREGAIVHNENREVLENMDALPWVTPVYKRDLDIENYFGGYLKHPYISFYTGRGCKSRCTFCLWPQTVGGHRLSRALGRACHRGNEMGEEAFPQVKEILLRR